MTKRRLLPLAPSHAWCDRRCERCPLAHTCALHIHETREAKRSAALRLDRRGEDAAFALADVVRELAAQLPMDAPREAREAVMSLRDAAVQIVTKRVRIAGLEQSGLASAWIADAAPNVVLVVRCIGEARAAVHTLATFGAVAASTIARARGALQRLDREMAPWCAAVPRDVAAEIAIRAALGLAPSPFSVVEAARPRAQPS